MTHELSRGFAQIWHCLWCAQQHEHSFLKTESCSWPGSSAPAPYEIIYIRTKHDRSVCGAKPTTGKLILARGTRLWESSHPCGDGVNNAQTPVLQGKLKLHSCCCEEQQQWHGADLSWPLVGSDSICAVSVARMGILLFFTGTQELLQLSLCPILCQCFWGEDQKNPSSHFDGSQVLCCVHKASGSKGWEVGMTEYFSFSFH